MADGAGWPMQGEAIDKFMEAGRISAKARDLGYELCVEGARLEDIADRIEARIFELGGRPSFPVNLSLNEWAAHYTPFPGDPMTLKRGDVIKVDCGAHIDGYTGDTAVTREIGTRNYTDMIEASRTALEVACNIVRAGLPLKQLAEHIEREIRNRGFKPIENLTGHGLGHYDLHAGNSIPNVARIAKGVLEAGQTIAIEPFVTDGAGHIEGTINGHIYRILRQDPISDPKLEGFFSQMRAEFANFPFAARWCVPFEEKRWKVFLRKLVVKKYVKNYPVFAEVGKGQVTQFEHALLVTEDGCEISTKY